MTIEQRFPHQPPYEVGWAMIIATYYANRHCFERGCGRETLAHWVSGYCGYYLTARYVRAVLMESVRRGIATKTNLKSRSYSVFDLHTDYRVLPQGTEAERNEKRRISAEANSRYAYQLSRQTA